MLWGKNPHILKSGKLPNEFYKQMNEILDKAEKCSWEFINVKDYVREQEKVEFINYHNNLTQLRKKGKWTNI